MTNKQKHSKLNTPILPHGKITSGQSNLTKAASPPHMDGSLVFAKSRQCAVCTLPNTCFFGPTRFHNPNGISIGSAIFAQLTAGGQYISQWVAVPPSKLPTRIRRSGPHLTHGSLGPCESTSQTKSQSVQPFCTAHDRDRQTDRRTTLFRLQQYVTSA